MSKRGNSAGFTMVEAVVVLVLLGVIVAVAIPRLANADSGLYTEEAVLKSHLRYAQSMAMANNVATWTVNIGATSYSLLKNGSPSLLPGEAANIHTFTRGVRATASTMTMDDFGGPGANDVSFTLTDTAGRTVGITVLGITGFIP